MSYFLGQIAGSILAMGILSLILSQFAFKNSPPTKRAISTVLVAFAIGVLVYGSQDGGTQFVPAIFFYGIGAVVVFFERRYHYNKHWSDDESGLSETFR